MQYEWDSDKALSNRRKHGMDFADAVGVLEDPYALTIEDLECASEQRFIPLGADFLGRILAVVHTYRRDQIRFISARPATKKEVKHYEKRI